MKVGKTNVEQIVLDVLWRKAEDLRTFRTDQLYWPANDLLGQNRELAFTLVRRLVVQWKEAGKIRKPQGAKRNAPWEVV